MLDDLQKIAAVDTANSLEVAGKLTSQLDWNFDVSVTVENEIQNIVVGGMGGSALYAEFYRVWPGASLPFEIVRDYNLPKYVSKHTLYIASSISGNTEEALEGLRQAEERGCTIAVLAAGGKLVEIAEAKGYPLALIDGTIPQPRMSTMNAIKGLLSILVAAGVEEADRITELVEAGKNIAHVTQDWQADVPTEKNLAKQTALELEGRSVVVYSGRQLFPIANKFKINSNENAKNVAWVNTFPEQNHNEFIGWSSHPVDKPYALVNIVSKFEHPRIAKRYEVQDKLLSGKRPQPIYVEMQGDTLVEQLLFGILFADMMTIYLAVLNGVDPTPVDLVEQLKGELDK